MKSLWFAGDSKIEVIDVPEPTPTPDEVVIDIKVSALCGSEMGVFRSPSGRDGNPGHEFAGEIVDTNGHSGFEVGDRVGAHVIVGCGTCAHCQTGNQIFCSHMLPSGYAHAEYIAVSARHCLKIPDKMDWDTGVLVAGDAMGVAYHLTQRVGVQAHDTVAVFGCGPVGLGVVALWSFLGARVIGVDMSPYRRDLAEKLGAWKTVEAGRQNTLDRLRKLTGGAGPDTCLECTGRPEAVAMAFEAARKGGKLGIVGEQGEATFNPSRDLIHKELSVYGAWYFRLSEFPGMVELCNRGLKPKKVVTHRFPLKEAQKGYDLMAQQKCGKVLFVQY
jgi:threonine dehydrogenase-like Zn-dependent dehydrogenase